MMHFAAVSVTDHTSVGFSDSLDMYGDTVDRQGSDMMIYSRTMRGRHSIPKVKSGEYITNQKLQYVDGMLESFWIMCTIKCSTIKNGCCQR